jgi:hypothetical protein
MELTGYGEEDRMTAVATKAGRVAEADRAELLAAAEESLGRLARLLDVSRLQAGARAVFPRPADVGEIIAAALVALGPEAKPVRADVPSGLPEVMADPAVAGRVIVNLAGNALRYSPAAAPPLLTARAGLAAARGLAETMGGAVEPEDTPVAGSPWASRCRPPRAAGEPIGRLMEFDGLLSHRHSSGQCRDSHPHFYNHEPVR